MKEIGRGKIPFLLKLSGNISRKIKGEKKQKERKEKNEIISAKASFLSFVFNLASNILLVKSLQRPFIFKIERLGRVIMRYYV